MHLTEGFRGESILVASGRKSNHRLSSAPVQTPYLYDYVFWRSRYVVCCSTVVYGI